MSSWAPVLLVAFGGFLIGGAWSVRRQRRPAWITAVVAALGVLCVVAGVLYL